MLFYKYQQLILSCGTSLGDDAYDNPVLVPILHTHNIYILVHTLMQASSEVGILRELHSELESEAKELRSLANRVNVLPDDIISSHLWLLVAQSIVVMAVFFVSCLWLCHMNHNLEQKLNVIQTTLSQTMPNHVIIPSQSTSSSGVAAASESITNNQQKAEIDLEQSYRHHHERVKSTSNCSPSSTHARSLSFTSVGDLHRQAENIGDLSRAHLKCLTTNRSKSWHESRVRGGGLGCYEREMATVVSSGGYGPLASHSLSSLDDRRSTAEVSS
jgi:hypothetical protein